MKQIHEIKEYYYPTTNTKIATCLSTLGVPLKKNNPCVNVYDANSPGAELSRTHPKWSPGKLTWFLEGESRQGVKTEAIVKAYQENTGHQKFDELLNQLEQSAIKSENVDVIKKVQELKEFLPFAAASYIRFALENRERLVDVIKKAEELVLVKRGSGFVLLSKNASEKTKQELLT